MSIGQIGVFIKGVTVQVNLDLTVLKLGTFYCVTERGREDQWGIMNLHNLSNNLMNSTPVAPLTCSLTFQKSRSLRMTQHLFRKSKGVNHNSI